MRYVIFLCAALASANVSARCVYPEKPKNLPDGNTATEAQMLESNKTVMTYRDDMQVFLNCLNDKAESLNPETENNQIEILGARHDAAFDELTAVATKFNEAVRIFKTRSN